MNLLDVIRTGARSDWPDIGVDEWISMFRLGGPFAFGGPFGLLQTLPGADQELPPYTFPEYARQLYRDNSIIFSCLNVRMNAFTQARFKYRRMRNGKPGDLWGDQTLQILEQPWPGATTATLLAHMEQDSSIAGNSYVARIAPDRLRRLRPDWIWIMLGSHQDPDIGAWDVDAEVLGYIYHPGGIGAGRDPHVFLPEEICHYKPIPDPEAEFRGMSWMTPVIQEVLGDKAATRHKLAFFENNATVNLAIKMDPQIKPEEFQAWKKIFDERTKGAANAYKTLFLGGGADVTPIGANMQQMDFKATVGVSETRVAAAAGTPPTIVGLSEGLQGSSLNEGNYGQARRRMADLTMRPLWETAAGALARIVPPPPDSELWYDDDIAFLKDDQKDAATTRQADAATLATLIAAGFDPDSAVEAVSADDWSLLVHTGLVSVQLQPPADRLPPEQNQNGNAPSPAGAAT